MAAVQHRGVNILRVRRGLALLHEQRPRLHHLRVIVVLVHRAYVVDNLAVYEDELAALVPAEGRAVRPEFRVVRAPLAAQHADRLRAREISAVDAADDAVIFHRNRRERRALRAYHLRRSNLARHRRHIHGERRGEKRLVFAVLHIAVRGAGRVADAALHHKQRRAVPRKRTFPRDGLRALAQPAFKAFHILGRQQLVERSRHSRGRLRAHRRCDIRNALHLRPLGQNPDLVDGGEREAPAHSLEGEAQRVAPHHIALDRGKKLLRRLASERLKHNGRSLRLRQRLSARRGKSRRADQRQRRESGAPRKSKPCKKILRHNPIRIRSVRSPSVNFRGAAQLRRPSAYCTTCPRVHCGFICIKKVWGFYGGTISVPKARRANCNGKNARCQGAAAKMSVRKRERQLPGH